MDMDSSGNIVSGGESSDSDLLYVTSGSLPFIVFMEQGGNYRWTKQFTLPNTYTRVNAIKFTSDSSESVFVLDDSNNLLILSIKSTDGTISKQYSYGSAGLTYQDGILIDSSDNVYVATRSNGYWKIFKFQLSSGTISFHLTSSNSNTANYLGAITFDNAKTNIFATGILNTNTLALASISINGAVNYQYGSTSKSYLLNRIAAYSSSTIYTCSQSSGSEMALIKFTISSSTSAPTGRQVLLYSGDANCLAIYGSSTTMAYALVRINGGYYTYLVQIQFSTSCRFNTGFSFNMLFSDSNSYINHGTISSSSLAYWVGQVKTINKSSALTFTQKVGMIMTSDSASCSNCVGSFTIDFGNTVIQDTTWTWTSSLSDSIYTESKTLTTITSASSKNVKSFTGVDFSWCNTTSTTITSPTLYSQSYDIYTAVGNSSYTFDAFTISSSSCTYSFTYVGVQSDQSDLPSGVTFTSSTRTFTFSGATSVGTYTLMVVAYLNNGYTSTAQFSLTITDTSLCDSASISASTVSTQTYIVTESQLQYQFTAFTISESSCSLSYTLTKTDLSAYDSDVFGFTSSNRTLSVHTTDEGKTATYNLRITGTIVEGSVQQSAYVDIQVQVKSKCYLSTITTSSIDTFTYSIYSNANATLSSLGWTQLHSDCPSLTYSLTDTDCNCSPPNIFSIISDSYITLYTVSSSYATTYNLKVTATNGYTSGYVTFSGTINQDNPCTTTVISAETISSQTYTTTDSAKTVSFNEWTESIGTCSPFTYSAKFSNNTQIDNTAGNVIRFDSSSRQFKIETSDPYEDGTYSITVTGTLSNGGVQKSINFIVTIASICTTSSITSSSPGDQTYIIMSGQSIYTFDEWAVSSGTCGSFLITIKYTLNSSTTQNDFPITDSNGIEIASYSSRTFTIDTTDQTLSGNIYTIIITGTCIQREIEEQFKITLQSCSVTTISSTQTIDSQTYTLKDATLPIPISDYTYSPTYCTSTITYSVSVDGYSSIPSMITGQLTSSPLSLSVYTTSTSDIGSYTIIVTGTVTNYDSSTVSNSITIPLVIKASNLYAPYFSPALEDLQITVGSSEKISLNLIDDDGDTGEITSINFGKASTFVKGSGNSYTISPTKDSQAGFYAVIISVTDNNVAPLTATYSFLITVSAPISNSTSQNETTNSTNSTSNSSDNSNNTSNSNTTSNQSNSNSSNGGYIPIKNTTKNNVVTKNVSTSLGAFIDKITQQGEMTVKFTSDILIPANYTRFNESMLKIILNPSEYNTDNDTQIASWAITLMTSKTMTIYLNFKYPQKISLYVTIIIQIITFQAKDKIQIQFIQNGYFIELSTGKAIPQQYITKPKDITKQLYKDTSSQALVESAGSIQSSLQTLMYGNLAVNIVMAASLQYLWGMINVLQLIVNMPLFTVSFPSNAVMFYSLIVGISNFDIIPLDDLKQSLFSFTESQASDQAQKNLGSMIAYIVGVIVALAFTLFLKYMSKRNKLQKPKQFNNEHYRINKIYTVLSRILFFNVPLRLMLEGYMAYSISSIMNLTSVIYIDLLSILKLLWITTSDKISSSFAIIMLFILLTFPIFVWILLWKKFKVLDEEKARDTYGALYAELKITKVTLLYNVLFMFRRIIFVIIALVMPNHPYLQIQALLLQCIGMIIFNFLAKPFEDPLFNRIEIFNEICIIAAAYHMLLFTPYMTGEDIQYQSGWSLVAITALNIAVNMGLMIGVTVGSLRLKLKKIVKWIKYKLKTKRTKKYLTPISMLNYSANNSVDQTMISKRDEDIHQFESQVDNPNVFTNIDSGQQEQMVESQQDVPHRLFLPTKRMKLSKASSNNQIRKFNQNDLQISNIFNAYDLTSTYKNKIRAMQNLIKPKEFLPSTSNKELPIFEKIDNNNDFQDFILNLQKNNAQSVNSITSKQSQDVFQFYPSQQNSAKNSDRFTNRVADIQHLSKFGSRNNAEEGNGFQEYNSNNNQEELKVDDSSDNNFSFRFDEPNLNQAQSFRHKNTIFTIGVESLNAASDQAQQADKIEQMGNYIQKIKTQDLQLQQQWSHRQQ